MRHLRQIEQQVREIRGLSRKLLTLQDELLGEVAVELHAQAMPDIAGVMRTLEFAQRKFVPGDLEEARERLQEVLDYLRALTNDFDPPMLALADLRAMLRDYAVSFTRKRDLPVIFNVDGDSVEVPKKVRQAVLRVFEEALNNAWQHAEAEKIEAALDLQPHRVHLEIQDVGAGFVMGSTLGALANGGHTGLLGMRERIEGVGGTWHGPTQRHGHVPARGRAEAATTFGGAASAKPISPCCPWKKRAGSTACRRGRTLSSGSWPRSSATANGTIAWTRMLDEEPTPGGLVLVPAVRAGKFHTAHKLTREAVRGLLRAMARRPAGAASSPMPAREIGMS